MTGAKIRRATSTCGRVVDDALTDMFDMRLFILFQ
jgi:hypothetical protein